MAECFCGCHRKVKFLDRNLNRQGRYTVELTERISAARKRLAEHGPYGEGGDIGPMLDRLDGMAEEGDRFKRFWESVIHGEPIPPDAAHGRLLMADDTDTALDELGAGGFGGGGLGRQEARQIRKNWDAWWKTSKPIVELFELPPDDVMAAVEQLESAD